MPKSDEAFRTISEVADELDVQKHVLRFWEAKFPQLRPMKRGGGRRYYRPDELELLRGIRHLLQNDGYTIKGVQKILREQGIEAVKSSWRTAPASAPTAPSLAQARKRGGPKPAIAPALKSREAGAPTASKAAAGRKAGAPAPKTAAPARARTARAKPVLDPEAAKPGPPVKRAGPPPSPVASTLTTVLEQLEAARQILAATKRGAAQAEPEIATASTVALASPARKRRQKR